MLLAEEAGPKTHCWDQRPPIFAPLSWCRCRTGRNMLPGWRTFDLNPQVIWSDWHSSCDDWSSIRLSCWFLQSLELRSESRDWLYWAGWCYVRVLHPGCALGPLAGIWKNYGSAGLAWTNILVISVRPKYSLADVCLCLVLTLYSGRFLTCMIQIKLWAVSCPLLNFNVFELITSLLVQLA